MEKEIQMEDLLGFWYKQKIQICIEIYMECKSVKQYYKS